MLPAMGVEEVPRRLWVGPGSSVWWYWALRVYAQMPTFASAGDPWRGYP